MPLDLAELQHLGCLGTENGLRKAVTHRVQEVARGQLGPHYLGQGVGGGIDADTAGLGGRDERRPVDVLVLDLVDGGIAVHAVHVANHRRSGVRQDFVVAEKRLPRGDREQVRPESIYLGQ